MIILHSNILMARLFLNNLVYISCIMQYSSSGKISLTQKRNRQKWWYMDLFSFSGNHSIILKSLITIFIHINVNHIPNVKV